VKGVKVLFLRLPGIVEFSDNTADRTAIKAYTPVGMDHSVEKSVFPLLAFRIPPATIERVNGIMRP